MITNESSKSLFFQMFVRYLLRLLLLCLYFYSYIFFIFIRNEYIIPIVLLILSFFIFWTGKNLYGGRKAILRYFLNSILWILIVFYHIHYFMLDVYYVKSYSMYPFLKPNRVIVVDKFTMGFIVPSFQVPFFHSYNNSFLRLSKPIRELRGGDVIVFWDDITKKKYVKRIIATSNKKITFYKDGKVKVNNDFLKDFATGNFFQLTNKELFFLFSESRKKSKSFSIDIPDKKYYVMGDNHIASKDSREVGFIDEHKIIGRVVYPISL